MKRWSLLVLAGLLVGILVGFVPSPAGAQQPIVIKLGNVQPADMSVNIGLRKFADLVAERTKNQIQVQVFPASQLGTEQEILEGVQLGTVHMFEGSTGAVGRFLPELEAFAAPYIWRDTDHMLKVVRGPIGNSLADRLVKAKGMRILIRAMGANPTPMDWKEVYLGLQSGVIDGQENPPSVIYSAKLFEVQKYVMLTGHITQNQAIVINEKFYQGLSPAFQKILLDAAIEAGNFQNDLVVKQEKTDLERLKEKGMTIVQPDVRAFREATRDVHKKYTEKWEPRFYERIQEVK